MKKICLSILLACTLASPSVGQGDPERGFEPLFNGRDLAGWEEVDGFLADEGTILTRGAKAGDLFTQAEYGNYILRFDYKLSEVGNSGVFLRAEPGNVAESGFEVQLLAPWTPYRDDLHCTGSLYGHVPVTNRPDESTGIWHSMEIVLDRDIVIVSVDGQMASWAQTERVDTLHGKNPRGRIGFQGNHSNPEQWVRFRNPRIKNLDTDVDYVLRGFRWTDPQIRRTTHDTAVQLGAAAIPGLCQLIAAPDPVGPSAAREALFAIAARASAPDFPRASRDAMREMLGDEREKAESPEVKGYLGWLRRMLTTDD
jgi:hypothetical protein